MDNGLELISATLKQWAKRHSVDLVQIQPGKPPQNAYIERFNRTFRAESLDRFAFIALDEARRMAEDWRHRYTHHRPRRSMGGLSPHHYAMENLPSTSSFK
ncbi:integrase core domain-containing protein [Lysobacter firmicutimachus]|uniref:Integrase core domain-containing protein n=1 Tax=Lysobacter firmicutimachus TaxID=1792846 RepID=A0ABU8CXE9_9GAMM